MQPRLSQETMSPVTLLLHRPHSGQFPWALFPIKLLTNKICAQCVLWIIQGNEESICWRSKLVNVLQWCEIIELKPSAWLDKIRERWVSLALFCFFVIWANRLSKGSASDFSVCTESWIKFSLQDCLLCYTYVFNSSHVVLRSHVCQSYRLNKA